MLRKIAAAGATAAAIVGVGTAALAASGPATTGSGQTAKTHQAKEHRTALRAALRRSVHAEITTKGKDGYVTRSAIRGTVTAVSAASISVKAADGFSETFTLTKDTKVRKRADGTAKGVTAGVSDVKSGDRVAVLGKAADKPGATPTATLVVDGLKK